mgnify:CR=1 FL=1
MRMSFIIKKILEVYHKYIKPIFVEVTKERPFEEKPPVVQPPSRKEEYAKLAERCNDLQRADQRAKKVLNPLATKLINYVKAINSYKGDVPDGFSFIPDLEKIYESINANLTGNAMKRFISLFANKGLEKAIGYNEWALEKLKGDVTFPYDDFQALTEIVERQQSILVTFKSYEERIKTQMERQQAEVDAILGDSFQTRSDDFKS